MTSVLDFTECTSFAPDFLGASPDIGDPGGGVVAKDVDEIVALQQIKEEEWCEGHHNLAGVDALNRWEDGQDLEATRTLLNKLCRTVESWAIAFAEGLVRAGYPALNVEDKVFKSQGVLSRLELMINFLDECRIKENVELWIRGREELEAEMRHENGEEQPEVDLSHPCSNGLERDTLEAPFQCEGQTDIAVEDKLPSNCSSEEPSPILEQHGRKPGYPGYACLCGSTFGSEKTLGVHLKVNKADKIFRCQSCDARFYLSSTLKNHLRTVHGRNTTKTFGCTRCGDYFQSRGKVLEHIKKAHPRNLSAVNKASNLMPNTDTVTNPSQNSVPGDRVSFRRVTRRVASLTGGSVGNIQPTDPILTARNLRSNTPLQKILSRAKRKSSQPRVNKLKPPKRARLVSNKDMDKVELQCSKNLDDADATEVEEDQADLGKEIRHASELSNSKDFNGHGVDSTKAQLFMCLCGRKFRDDERLRVHIRHGTVSSRFSCATCSGTKSYYKSFQMVAHFKQCHKIDRRIRSVKCGKCDESSASILELWEHNKGVHAASVVSVGVDQLTTSPFKTSPRSRLISVKNIRLDNPLSPGGSPGRNESLPSESEHIQSDEAPEEPRSTVILLPPEDIRDDDDIEIINLEPNNSEEVEHLEDRLPEDVPRFSKSNLVLCAAAKPPLWGRLKRYY